MLDTHREQQKISILLSITTESCKVNKDKFRSPFHARAALVIRTFSKSMFKCSISNFSEVELSCSKHVLSFLCICQFLFLQGWI